ncbi:hypothetical protein VV089_12620 [Candidatus Merdisoma sp. JLR.KK011]|uniref:hypothetical protein n=1 Tax=Candidatus Merdisoma sp. JLR.KK011 TaxID=3114299 RepID=UPI002FF13785
MKNYVITGVLLLFLTAASFFLPIRVLKWQDEQRTGKSEIEEVQEVVLKEQISMTLSEKLKLRNQETVNALTLVNGKNYNKDTIEDQIRKEIGILADQDILIDFDMESMKIREATVTFYVDMEDSERSIMFWQGYVETLEYDVSFFLDDETGKIVSFAQYAAGPVADYAGAAIGLSRDMSMEMEEQKELARRWAEYLGCEMKASSTGWYGIGQGAEEELFEKEIDMLISKGYSYEEAGLKVALAWGISVDRQVLRVVFEDNGDTIQYTLGITESLFQMDVNI